MACFLSFETSYHSCLPCRTGASFDQPCTTGTIVERQDSEGDFLDEFDVPNRLYRIEMKYALENELGIPVDLLTDESLHPLLRDRILHEAKEF